MKAAASADGGSRLIYPSLPDPVFPELREAELAV